MPGKGDIENENDRASKQGECVGFVEEFERNVVDRSFVDALESMLH